MKFLKCISHKKSSPKSNVSVRKLKKSKKKRTKKKNPVKTQDNKKRSRNSYIASSFNRNFYPTEQFPRRSFSSHDIIEAYESPNNEAYIYNYNLETGRRTKSEPEMRAETAYADYLRYYQKQILDLQIQNQARMKANQVMANTPLICDSNNNNQNNNGDYGFLHNNSHQNIDLQNSYNMRQQYQALAYNDGTGNNTNRMFMYQHQIPLQHNLKQKFVQQQQQQYYGNNNDGGTSVRILNSHNNRHTMLGNDLSYLNGEEYHLLQGNNVFPSQMVKKQQIPTQLLHMRKNNSINARFSYPQCFNQATNLFSKKIFSSTGTLNRKTHQSHDKSGKRHHRRSKSKVFNF